MIHNFPFYLQFDIYIKNITACFILQVGDILIQYKINLSNNKIEQGKMIIGHSIIALTGAFFIYDLFKFKKLKEQQLKKPEKTIKLCLTGGPCGGKSQGINCIYNTFMQVGAPFFIVPQAATIIGSAGLTLDFSHFDSQQIQLFQINLMRLQYNLQKIFQDLAKTMEKLGKCPVLLCDRGLLDGKAYAGKQNWDRMLKLINITQQQINARYKAVIHMQTAARGATQNYFYVSDEKPKLSAQKEQQKSIEIAAQEEQIKFKKLIASKHKSKLNKIIEEDEQSKDDTIVAQQELSKDYKVAAQQEQSKVDKVAEQEKQSKDDKAAEQEQQLKGNKVRKQAPQVAIQLDQKIQECYKNHPARFIIRNYFFVKDFDIKKILLIAQVNQILQYVLKRINIEAYYEEFERKRGTRKASGAEQDDVNISPYLNRKRKYKQFLKRQNSLVQ